MQPLVFEHFSSNDHNVFLEDCSVTFIEKTDRADPTRKEEYWRNVGKIVTPYGLNTVDWFFHLGKLINFCTILCFSKEGCLHRKIHTSDIFYYEYLLFVSLGFVCCCFIIISFIILLLLLLLLLLVFLLISLLLLILYRIALLNNFTVVLF